MASKAQVYTSCAFACWCLAPNPKGSERFALSLLSRYASATPASRRAIFSKLSLVMHYGFCRFRLLLHIQNPINIMLCHLQIYHPLPSLFILAIELIFL